MNANDECPRSWRKTALGKRLREGLVGSVVSGLTSKSHDGFKGALYGLWLPNHPGLS